MSKETFRRDLSRLDSKEVARVLVRIADLIPETTASGRAAALIADYAALSDTEQFRVQMLTLRTLVRKLHPARGEENPR